MGDLEMQYFNRILSLESERDRWKAKAKTWQLMAERLAEALKAMQMEAEARHMGLRITDEALAAFEKMR